MQLTNQNCEARLRQILQWNYSFVLNLILLGHVSENGTTLNVLRNRIGRNKSWWNNLPVVRFAYPNDFGKNEKQSSYTSSAW